MSRLFVSINKHKIVMSIKIEDKYQEYLQLVRLKESGMHPVQSKVMRETFFAAWGMCLTTQRDEVGEMDEDTAIGELEAQMRQVKTFFYGIDKRAN